MNRDTRNRTGAGWLTKLLLAAVALIQGSAFSQGATTAPPAMEQLEAMVGKITWIEQATTRIQTGAKTIYIDPYVIKKNDQADIILITHSHGDHLSPPDIALLPIHRPYSFNILEDTVQAALDCKARIVVPIHYGYNCGDPQDAIKLKQALSGKCEVLIKERSR